MDTLLILLGVLGFGAIIIAIHVFSVDSVDSEAHRYRHGDPSAEVEPKRGHVERSGGDRRSGLLVAFPLLINGTMVKTDRRLGSNRRQNIS